MPPRVSIRAAGRQDAPAIRRMLQELDALHARIRPDVFQTCTNSEQLDARAFRFVDQDDAELFVADIEESCVGLAFVRVSPNPAAPMFRPGDRALIDDLFVEARHRRTGIARLLLERVSKWARSRGISSLGINVWNANGSGVSFFTSFGFVPRCQQMELQVARPD